MSIKATNWAWGLVMPPTPKLILMALADESDDLGNCWPSIKRIARKACVSDRTVRRVLKECGDSGLVVVSARTRQNGGQSSNKYTLLLHEKGAERWGSDPPDNLSPPDTVGREGVSGLTPAPRSQLCHAAPDVAMSGHYPLLVSSSRTTTTTNLASPRSLVHDDAELAKEMVLKSISDPTIAQQLLDELDAAIRGKRIKGPWFNYFHALILRAIEGRFIYSAGRSLEVERKSKSSLRDRIGLPPKENISSKESVAAFVKAMRLNEVDPCG